MCAYRIEVLNTCLAVNLLVDIDDGWAIDLMRGKHKIYIYNTNLENTGYGICKTDADNWYYSSFRHHISSHNTAAFIPRSEAVEI